MKGEHFILKGKDFIEVDFVTWAKWFETADRTVKKDKNDEITVSTVFLGLNHSWNKNAPPLLFETLVFGGEFDGEMQRYTTYEESEAGHDSMCERVFGDDSILEATEIY